MSEPSHYLVIDVEATCDDQGRVPKHEMEIIELGAVLVAASTLEPVSELQTFVRPGEAPKLTASARSSPRSPSPRSTLTQSRSM